MLGNISGSMLVCVFMMLSIYQSGTYHILACWCIGPEHSPFAVQVWTRGNSEQERMSSGDYEPVLTIVTLGGSSGTGDGSGSGSGWNLHVTKWPSKLLYPRAQNGYCHQHIRFWSVALNSIFCRSCRAGQNLLLEVKLDLSARTGRFQVATS